MKIAITLLMTWLLSGCAALNQMYAAKAASSAVALRTSQDNVVDTLMFAICAVPYGTVVRRQDFQETAKAACLPKNGATASDLIPNKTDK